MIGLLGGSFDPIHHGHLIVAQALKESLGLAEVRFVPAREQPFKRGSHAAPAELRARMVSLALAGEPGFTLERLELDRPGPSYTVDTLRTLGARELGARFALLIGTDAANEFSAWREAAEIQRLAEVVVFSRSGAGLTDGRAFPKVIGVPAVDISATDIRRRVRQGLSIRYRVPDAVAEVIAAHGLYLEAE